MTALPVLGVPIRSPALPGMDSLLSIVQMPAGVPVGTLAIGKAGAVNAALLAAAILALFDPALARALACVPRIPRRDRERRRPGPSDELKAPGTLTPGATIGILGGGQLARMLAMAGARLGLKSHIFAPTRTSRPSTSARRARSPHMRTRRRWPPSPSGRRRNLRVRERAGADASSFSPARAGAARAQGARADAGPARREAIRGGTRDRDRRLRRRGGRRRAGARRRQARAAFDLENPPPRL